MTGEPLQGRAAPLQRATDPALQPAPGPGLALSTAAPLQGGEVVVVVLVDFAAQALWWGWSRLVLQRWPLRRVSGLRFAKVLGSGQDGGFGLRPSRTRQGLFLAFGDETLARDFIAHSPVMAGYRAHARELCVALLQACSSKGSWSGTRLQASAEAPSEGPIAALTRASIRPSRARRFWRIQPGTERALAQSSGCLLAAGLGEAPVLRQATFSLWENAAAMDAYARSGAHGDAIRAAYSGGFFSETMFVRFRPLSLQGSWQGMHYG